MQDTIEKLESRLSESGYYCDDALATTLILMRQLQRPLLLEGEAGVGKTEVAKILAKSEQRPFIRLQCYEGLTANEAIYEWNYNKQLLHMQQTSSASQDDSSVFSETFLLERPLLSAIRQTTPPILLIDEIDRADDAFEAFLLELLSEFQISIPELGTISATSKPDVILTSNHTRELSDALRRRCLYHYLDYPDFNKELNILTHKVTGLSPTLSEQIIRFVQQLRQQDLRKKPGVAETLDWANALYGLGVTQLDQSITIIESTRSCLLKHQSDYELLETDSITKLVHASC